MIRWPIHEIIFKVKAERPEFSVYCGRDDHLLNTLSFGGDGAIAGSTNFAPYLQFGIYQSFFGKKYGIIRWIPSHARVLPLLYEIDAPLVNVIKETMLIMGMKISRFHSSSRLTVSGR